MAGKSQKGKGKRKLPRMRDYAREQPNEPMVGFFNRDRINQAIRTVRSLWSQDGYDIPGTKRRLEVVKKISSSKKEQKPIALVARGEFYENMFHWVYYPGVRESIAFADAVRWTRRGGLNMRFPGSVGVVLAVSHGTDLRISVMQGSFIQGKPSFLTRSLVSRHGGWREHILRAVFDDAISERKNVVFLPYVQKPKMNEKLKKALKTQVEIVLKIAEEKGFKQDTTAKGVTEFDLTLVRK